MEPEDVALHVTQGQIPRNHCGVVFDIDKRLTYLDVATRRVGMKNMVAHDDLVNLCYQTFMLVCGLIWKIYIY